MKLAGRKDKPNQQSTIKSHNNVKLCNVLLKVISVSEKRSKDSHDNVTLCNALLKVSIVSEQRSKDSHEASVGTCSAHTTCTFTPEKHRRGHKSMALACQACGLSS